LTKIVENTTELTCEQIEAVICEEMRGTAAAFSCHIDEENIQEWCGMTNEITSADITKAAIIILGLYLDD